MRISTTFPVIIAFAFSFGAACNSKTEKTAASSATGKAATNAPSPARPAKKAGPPQMSAPAFYKDYKSLKGMAVFKKYGSGVIVSGKVKRTFKEMDGAFKVNLDAGGKNWVSLSFKDKGAAAKSKKLKAGDQAKARCKVGGAMGNYIMNIDCELL